MAKADRRPAKGRPVLLVVGTDQVQRVRVGYSLAAKGWSVDFAESLDAVREADLARYALVVRAPSSPAAGRGSSAGESPHVRVGAA